MYGDADQARDLSTALEKADELIALTRSFGRVTCNRQIFVLSWVTSSCLEHAQPASELGGGSPLPTYALCFALAAAGAKTPLALDHLVELSATQYVSPYFVGMSLLGAGDTDRGVSLLIMRLLKKAPGSSGGRPSRSYGPITITTVSGGPQRHPKPDRQDHQPLAPADRSG